MRERIFQVVDRLPEPVQRVVGSVVLRVFGKQKPEYEVGKESSSFHPDLPRDPLEAIIAETMKSNSIMIGSIPDQKKKVK